MRSSQGKPRFRKRESPSEGEDKYRMLFDSIDAGFCILEVVFDEQGHACDFRFLEINPAFEKHTGLAGAAGKTILEMAPQFDTYWFEVLGKVALTGEAMRFENSSEVLGRFFDVYAFRFGAPEERRVAVLFNDITARKRAEQALSESELRLRMIIENSRDGINVLDLKTGRYIFMSPAQVKMSGFSPEEVRDVTAEQASERVHPDDRELAISALRQAAAGQDPRGPVEYRWMVKSGEYRWFSDSRSVIRDEEGQPVALVGISRDITERKWAEENLRETEARLNFALESGQTGAWDLDLADHTAARSLLHDRIFGYETLLPEWTYEMFLEHVLPEDREEVERRFREAVKIGGDLTYECRIRRVDGEVRWIWVAGRHWRNESGVAHRMAGIVQDITERKRAEEELASAKQELEQRVAERTAELARRAAQLRALAGELTLAEQRERSRLAKILHDHLQQLLVAAKFRVTILGRGGDEIIRQASEEVEQLIDESIAASRSLTAELSPPILHEAGLCAGLQWLARRMADTQGLFVEVNAEEDATLPEYLKILLFESVRELLFNVVKHARTRSANVNLRRIDSCLQVTVSDHGIGFDPAVMAAAGEGGRGFGLFGIRERLELIGGKLEIQSAPGQGCRIVLSAPIAQPATEYRVGEGPGVRERPGPERIPSLHEERKKIRVLLADDHVVVRQGIANLLGDEQDIEVVGAAADGQQAVELTAKLEPDVILMDLSMPHLNGIEATRIIHGEFPEIRIIGLSMYEEADRAQAMLDAGAEKYLTKSGPAEELLRAIRGS